MTEHQFYIKKLIKGRGIFVSMKIEFIYLDNSVESKLVIEDDAISWKDAISFGFNYFIEHYIRNSQIKKLEVRVKKVNSMVVDTSPILVVYALVKMMSEATGYEIDVNLDETTGYIQFRH